MLRKIAEGVSSANERKARRRNQRRKNNINSKGNNRAAMAKENSEDISWRRRQA
jgi:hypothetical protein